MSGARVSVRLTRCRALGFGVFCSLRIELKVTCEVVGWFLRVRWFVTARKRTRRDRDSLRRRWRLLLITTRMAHAIGLVKLDLGRAAGDRHFSDLVWTSNRSSRPTLHQRVFHPASFRPRSEEHTSE